MANSKRKCNGCGEYFRPAPNQTFPGTVAWCCPEHGLIVAQKRVPAVKAKAARQERAQTKEAVRNLRRSDRDYQFRLTRSKAQRLANLRDKVAGFGCISCGTQKPTIQYCGGHFKTAGGNPEIALDLRNIHRQCNKRCNQQLSGNIYGTKDTKGYRQGLIDRYGIEYVDWLECYVEPKKYAIDDLIAIRKDYAARIRELEKQLI